jgi:integrase
MIFSQYEERLRRLKRNKRTIWNFQRAATLVREEFGNRLIADIEPFEWEEWVAGWPFAPSTKKVHVTNIRAAIHYGIKRGSIDKDTTYLIAIEQIQDRTPEIMTSLELKATLANCKLFHHFLLFYLLVYTGMRSFEIKNLEWDKVNLKREMIDVRGKGGKLRMVPIHPVLGEILHSSSYRLGGRVCRGVSYPTLHQIAPDISGFHVFRRTVASSLRRNKVDVEIRDAIMGWAPRRIGDRFYEAVTEDELKTAILRLYVDDPL